MRLPSFFCLASMSDWVLAISSSLAAMASSASEICWFKVAIWPWVAESLAAAAEYSSAIVASFSWAASYCAWASSSCFLVLSAWAWALSAFCWAVTAIAAAGLSAAAAPTVNTEPIRRRRASRRDRLREGLVIGSPPWCGLDASEKSSLIVAVFNPPRPNAHALGQKGRGILSQLVEPLHVLGQNPPSLLSHATCSRCGRRCRW